MTYVTAQARQELLDAVAESADAIGRALADVGEAYEQLDDYNADRLEEQLFRSLQAAYGAAKRTHAAFAARSGLPGGVFAQAPAGAPSHGVKGFLESAMAAVEEADRALVLLQDSMMPVEVGDAELRAGLAEVRRQLADLPARTRDFLRSLGR